MSEVLDVELTYQKSARGAVTKPTFYARRHLGDHIVSRLVMSLLTISDAAFLPLSLGESLVVLPTTPPPPVLLLVGGTCGLMATLVVIVGIIASTSLGQKIRNQRLLNFIRRHPSLPVHTRQQSTSDTDSLASLVETQPVDETYNHNEYKSTPHLAYLAFTVAAFGLSLGATITEMVILHRASVYWNADEAGQVGLTMKLGAIAYRECSVIITFDTVVLPCIPISLLLSLLIAYIPSFHLAWAKLKPIKSTQDIEVSSTRSISPWANEKMSGPWHIEATTRIPEEWTRVSLDRRQSGVGTPTSTGKREWVRRSVRDVDRDCVGIAV